MVNFQRAQAKLHVHYFDTMTPTNTVNSLYCRHPQDRKLVSLIARVHNSGNLVQSHVRKLFLPGI